MSSNETAAYKIMKMLDVDYVLVIFGGVIGYSGDDINKFLWMVRIAEGEHPQEIKVSQHVNSPNSLPETWAILNVSGRRYVLLNDFIEVVHAGERYIE